MYRPDNAIVFITGSKLDAREILSALDEVDGRLAARKLPPMSRRPFSAPIDPLVPKTGCVV
jgi:hypothetical protein